MPPRRPHQKSRHGCERCKSRRIKCDETGPPCSYCLSKNADCHYSSFRHSQFNGQDPAAARPKEQTQVPANSHIAKATPIERNRIQDLQLMHHWCTKTSHSFSEKLHPAFLNDITNTALSQHNTYTYLLDSIFALTSLHMASEAPAESNPVYIKNALEYQNTAVPAFRSALENVTESNCDALFASAIILMACAIISPLLSKQDTTTSSLLLLFDFVKGVHYIIHTGREWLQNGPFKEFITIHPEEELLSDEMPLTSPVRHLQSLDPAKVEKKNVYDRAIKILNYCFIHDNLAIPWLLIVGDEFMDELQNQEPLALMIYMYWGVLLSRLDGVWWAKLAGRKLVGELSVSILSGNIPGCGKEWKEAGIWAKREVGLVD